jgi:RloB-like protein
MANENHPRHRQARALARKTGTRAPYARILIVCEGEKTEVNYFKEIIKQNRLSSANIKVTNADGTNPTKIIDYAERLSKNFDLIYAVSDRDSHIDYFAALQRKTEVLKIISVSCFEFWLLLHFEDQTNFIDRKTALSKMKSHIAGYEKASKGIYALTKDNYPLAKARAENLRRKHAPDSGIAPYTNVDALVDVLNAIGLSKNPA